MAKANVKVVVNTPKPAIVKEAPKPPKAPEVPEGMFAAKEGEYRCIKKCYFGISLYNEGKSHYAAEGDLLPRDFFKKVKRVAELED